MRAMLLISISSLLVGCEPRAVSVGSEPGEPSGSPTGSSTPAFPAPTGDPDCETLGYRAGEIQYLGEAGWSIEPPGAPILATAGRVVFSNRSTKVSSGPATMDLFAADARTGELSQLTDDDHETVLLGAVGEVLLYVEGPRAQPYVDPPMPSRLRLRTQEGEIVDLGPYRPIGRIGRAGGSLYGARQLHQISPDGRWVAWISEQQLKLYNDGKTRVIAKLATPNVWLPPAVADGVVVWSDVDIGAPNSSTTKVRRWQEGGPETVETIEAVSDTHTAGGMPVLAAGHVLWRCGGDICVWDERRVGQLTRGGAPGCDEPVTDGQRAGWICAGAVHRYDPATGRVETIAAAEEGKERSVLRISGEMMAWIEVAPGVDPYRASATLVVSAEDHRLEVATVGLPCVVCGRYDPPFELSLHSGGAEGVLAWSYALRDDASPPATRYAFARIQREVNCR